VASGVLFGVLDGLMNANPLARSLYEVFEPISKKSINVPLGIVIDLGYGFALAGIFLILYDSFPGNSGVVKGIYFALMVWFLRVVMYATTQYMTLDVPAGLLAYILIAGMIEMVILGLVYGSFLKPVG